MRNYLTKKAVIDKKRWLGRTYLFVSRDDLTYILAYFTMAPKYIAIDDGIKLSKTARKKLNPDSRGVAQCRVLGHLWRSTLSERGFGDVVLRYAVDMMKSLGLIEGCRAVRIDCKPDNKLVTYYENHGFIIVQKNDDQDLVQMILMLDRPGENRCT